MRDNLSSGNLVADKRAGYARMLGDAGDFQAAAELMEQAVELAPGWAAGWFQVGIFHEKAGNMDQAAIAFEKTLAIVPKDTFGAALKLAHLKGESVARPETAYVEALFDDYADRFDASLVGKLNYQVPQLLSGLIRGLVEVRTFNHCIDLGCGTGLMAGALGTAARRFTGIDLSAGMLAKAAEKGLYQSLVQADLAAGLEGAAPADLIVAADVFMYFGDLAPVFSASAQRLMEDGVFAFSVELSGTDAGFELRPSLRHAHSKNYVLAAMAEAGLEPLDLQTAVIRKDGADDIEGLLVAAHKKRVVYE